MEIYVWGTVKITKPTVSKKLHETASNCREGELWWRWKKFCLWGGALLGALSRKVPSFGDDTFRALFSFHFSSEVITALTGKRCERIELPNNSSQNHAVDWGNESSVPSPSLFAQAESRWNRTKVIPGPEKSKLVHLRTLFPHGLKLAMKLEVMELLFILPPAVFFCVFSLFRHVWLDCKLKHRKHCHIQALWEFGVTLNVSLVLFDVLVLTHCTHCAWCAQEDQYLHTILPVRLSVYLSITYFSTYPYTSLERE